MSISNGGRRVYVVVEGQTEEEFVKKILAPLFFEKAVYLYPVMVGVGKRQNKGGRVRFERVRDSVVPYLRQRDVWATTMVDYYGLAGEWPGLAAARKAGSSRDKARIMSEAMARAIRAREGGDVARRFIPYFSMHELEALYFSDAAVLAAALGVEVAGVEAVVAAFDGAPEEINDSVATAPSKRIAALSPYFTKIEMGIPIAQKIGVDLMRRRCPVFGEWMARLEGVR